MLPLQHPQNEDILKMIEPSTQYFQEKTYKKRLRHSISSLIAASLGTMIIWFGLFLFVHLDTQSIMSKTQERLLDTIPGMRSTEIQ